jgi:protein-S-isoprenylcysteine O-methyltransferase Ste14
MTPKLITVIVIINACELFYIVSEIILAARTRQQTAEGNDQGTQMLVWIMIAGSFVLGWLPVILGFGAIFLLGDWLTWAGIAVMIGGIIFRRYVIRFLGKFFTGAVQIKTGHELIKTGPYRYIRHPSYLAILIITLGLGIALANWVSLAICIIFPSIGLARRISVEEKMLEVHFGNQYRDYKKNTRAIIPFIY